MGFHTGVNVNAYDDTAIEGQVNLTANGLNIWGYVGVDGKLHLRNVSALGTGLTLDSNGRIVVVNE